MDLKQLQDNWDRLAQEDALWAILTDPAKRGGKWDVQSFFETGRAEIDHVVSRLEQFSLPLGHKKALDFGCGVGRLTQAMAPHFDTVVAIDIAPTMIERAKQFNQHGDKCQFLLNERPDLQQLPSGEFDFIYTNIVLQHMQLRFARAYLKEFLRLLKPGAHLVFQMPAHPNQFGVVWRVKQVAKRILPRQIVDLFRTNRGQARMEIYGTALSTVVKLIERNGGQVQAIERNTSAGPNWCSYAYYVTKL